MKKHCCYFQSKLVSRIILVNSDALRQQNTSEACIKNRDMNISTCYKHTHTLIYSQMLDPY